MTYQLYRNTTLGTTLQDTLDELIQSGRMPPQLASKVVLQFDKAINTTLSQCVESRISFKANKLETYRFCDDVWTLMLSDIEFREGNEFFNADTIKIVACDGKSGDLN